MTVAAIYARRAELLRELAATEAALAEAIETPSDTGPKFDEAVGLTEAAALFGEPPNTFRQRLEYRKAMVSRPGERRLRYSRAVLERIRLDRLEGNRVER